MWVWSPIRISKVRYIMKSRKFRSRDLRAFYRVEVIWLNEHIKFRENIANLQEMFTVRKEKDNTKEKSIISSTRCKLLKNRFSTLFVSLVVTEWICDLNIWEIRTTRLIRFFSTGWGWRSIQERFQCTYSGGSFQQNHSSQSHAGNGIP